jgi:hypothetical protein
LETRAYANRFILALYTVVPLSNIGRTGIID